MKINQITQANPQIREASFKDAIKGNVQQWKDTFSAGKKSVSQEKQTTAPVAGANVFGQVANQLTQPETVDVQTQKFIQQLVASYQALTPEEKSQLKSELEDAVTSSDVASNIFKSTTESQRNKKKSVR